MAKVVECGGPGTSCGESRESTLSGGTDRGDYGDLQSVNKSIVSTLVGIAIGEGKISGIDVVIADSNVIGPDQGGDAIFRMIDTTVVPNLP